MNTAMPSGRDTCHLHVRIKTRASLGDIFDLPSETTPKISAFGMVEDTCSEGTYW
ncbi:MAG: hypothetical protein JXR23_01005 [Pontiellaceae bacterium]|nr:hypothetical protein [Pontiellaceae bacterium]